jgi:hypothetical protein
MPFKRTGAANVGVGAVVVYTVPALKVATLIDVACANVEPGGTEVKATVRQIEGATTINLVKDGPVPPGSSMVVSGAPRKVVMAAGDQLTAICDKANGFDIAVSYLEQDA